MKSVDLERDNNRSSKTKRVEPLSFRPLFSDTERSLILNKWEQEKFERAQRCTTLELEEVRLKALDGSERAKIVIAAYEMVKNRSFRGLRKEFISSKDDVIILLRHFFTNTDVTTNDNQEPSDNLRQRILATEGQTLEAAKLFNPLVTFFPSFQETLIASFPSFDMKIFQFSRVPPRFWSDPKHGKDRVRDAVRYKIEEEISKKDPEQFRESLTNLNLLTVLGPDLDQAIYSSGYKKTTQILIDIYPELKLKPWNFRTDYKGEAGLALAKEVIRWLVEDRLGLSPANTDFQIKLRRVTAMHFKQSGLGGLLNHKEFSRSHIRLIMLVYEDLQITEANFYRFPTNFWQGANALDNGISFTKDLIENKLGIKPDDPEFVTKIRRVGLKTFEKFGLGGMLRTIFGKSSLRALKAAYPQLSNLKEWELSAVPRNFWQQDNYANVGAAIRWLVEEKLGLTQSGNPVKEEVLQLKRYHIKCFSLEGMLGVTRLHLLKAIQIAYPQLNITGEEYLSSNRNRNHKLISSDRKEADTLGLLLKEYEIVLLSGQIMSFEEFMNMKEKQYA